MGAADIVPGVSGGSIALITGIYEELLDSINSFNGDSLKLLLKFEFKAFFQAVNGAFLLSLFLGIMTSIFSLSKLITYLMAEHPIPLWSFFCGLILVRAFLILKDIKKWSLGVVIALVIGTVAAYFITELPPTSSPDALWFTFVAGAIAICAMILPGISGSFILLILGKYESVLQALLFHYHRIAFRLHARVYQQTLALENCHSLPHIFQWRGKTFSDEKPVS